MILTIRPGDDAEQDALALRRRGVDAVAAPVLTITYVPLILPPASGFAGLIFTSRHAIDAFCVACNRSIADTEWADKPVFVVGHATAARARLAGFTSVITGSGGGAGLVPHIRQHQASGDGIFFWPAAAQKSFDLVAALRPHAIDVTCQTIYQTDPQASLPPAIIEAISDDQISAVISMSARTSHAFVELLQTHNLWHHRRSMILIAGSKGIADAAGDGWQKIYVARRPKRTRMMAIAVMVDRQGPDGAPAGLDQ